MNPCQLRVELDAGRSITIHSLVTTASVSNFKLLCLYVVSSSYSAAVPYTSLQSDESKAQLSLVHHGLNQFAFADDYFLIYTTELKQCR